MSAWWDGLLIMQKIYGLFAIPATLVMVLQTILSLIGLGHDASDTVDGLDTADSVADSAADAGDDGFRLFTVRGLTAFFALFGWTGFILSGGESSSPWVVIPGSILSGLAGMAVIGLMFYGFMRLQASGNLNLAGAVGLSATVYIHIPASRSGQGKVQVLLQERLSELPAVTDEAHIIPTGATVRILGVTEGRILLVGMLESSTV